MKKFTFIAEFKNGTYISQYKADNLMEAVLIWADNLDVQFFTNKVKTKIQEKVRDSFYSPVSMGVEFKLCLVSISFKSQQI